jgi:alkylation response protein AidB-like acyl-CoA dehydrogenase
MRLVELISTLLVAHGSEAQRRRRLPGLLATKIRAAYCITEPEAGTDVSGIRTEVCSAPSGAAST